MQKNLLVNFLFLVIFLFAVFSISCKTTAESAHKEQPVLGLVLPQGDEQWQKELIQGFTSSAKEFVLETQIERYNPNEIDSIVRSVKKVSASKDAPVCIVFLRREHVAPVFEELKNLEPPILNIGADDASVNRCASVAVSWENIAYQWKIRFDQLDEKPKNVLFVYGKVPIRVERFEAAIFSRSNKHKAFTPKYRELENITEEDIMNADLVCPIGYDAFEKVKSLGADHIIPFDGSDDILNLLLDEIIERAFAPPYFELGMRALRLAREYHIRGFVSNPFLTLNASEIDKESINLYLTRRYKLPPTVLKTNDTQGK